MTGKSTTDYIEATDGTGTPPAKSKAQVLTDVFALATEFSTCVEAFNRIHPHKDSDHAQKVALAKLGLQQGRLLIFGDALGISAPPANIARHMIPSHPGLTNPDPHLPVNFGVRDARLDEEVTNAKIRAALHEMSGRPSNMSRDELMNAYGLKSPKSFSKLEYPALDTNRLEGFREKYHLLQDLVKQTGTRTTLKRNMSMAANHWTVRESTKFEHYVKTVRTEVDALIDLMDVKEQVDRGIRSDLKSMGWHPDLTGPKVQRDYEKLRLIREACETDYPEYVEVIDKAMQYISEELKETAGAQPRAVRPTPAPTQEAVGARRTSDQDIRNARRASYRDYPEGPKTPLQLAAERALDPNAGKEKRPGWLSPAYSWFSGSHEAAVSDEAGETVDARRNSASRSNSASHPTADARRNSATHQSMNARRLSATHDLAEARRLSASHGVSDPPRSNSTSSAYRAIPEGPKTHLQLAAERALSPNAGKEKRPGWLSPKNYSRRNSVSHEGAEERRKSASHEKPDPPRSNSTTSAFQVNPQAPKTDQDVRNARRASYRDFPEGPKTPIQLAAERALNPNAGQEKRPGWLSPSYSWFSQSAHETASSHGAASPHSTGSQEAEAARRTSASHETPRSQSVSSAYRAIPEAPKTHLQLAAERALDPYAGQENRPGWLSMFKFKSWTKSGKQSNSSSRSNSVSDPTAMMDAQRSHSVGGYLEPVSEDEHSLEPTRSKSLSAIPQPATNDLDDRMGKLTHEPVIQENGGEVTTYPERGADKNGL
jgi:hypothetical protein